MKRHCRNAESQHFLKMCAMWEPLISSNSKSQPLDKERKIQVKHEYKETSTDKSMCCFLGDSGDVNCQGKWERVCKIKTSLCSYSKK